MQKLQIQYCNEGKASKFKRSSSNLEEDSVSSAILLLACIACAPSYPYIYIYEIHKPLIFLFLSFLFIPFFSSHSLVVFVFLLNSK
ncbi:hypothetical protein PVL29_022815 [Vitis rotundifolia]|uniref:Uncharacterized protein n=1 Tax=Vitis rotundifolia TaxID=103349 RepID=A0AA38YX39_VITRO|nr:hypothetical protein PVL29_022815 [Vitis rotundifolia]